MSGEFLVELIEMRTYMFLKPLFLQRHYIHSKINENKILMVLLNLYRWYLISFFLFIYQVKGLYDKSLQGVKSPRHYPTRMGQPLNKLVLIFQLYTQSHRMSYL